MSQHPDPSFSQFLYETYRRGELINAVFEERVYQKEVMVVPLVDLVRMKLTTFRLKDQVHVQALDTAGLITHPIQEQLPQELLARLEQVRQSE